MMRKCRNLNFEGNIMGVLAASLQFKGTYRCFCVFIFYLYLQGGGGLLWQCNSRGVAASLQI